jgi:hypothetical protein
MSGITIPATGSGTQNPSVATEVISSDHYQLFKLIDGNVGSLSPVGTSANPLFVRYTVSTLPITGTVLTQGGSLTAFQGAAPWTFIGSVNITGDVAAGSLDVGFPVKIGGYAISSAFPTSVGSGTRVNALFDRTGRQITMLGAPLALRQNKHNDFTGPLSGTVVWSAGVANRIIVTDFNVMAGSGTSGIVTLFYARSGAPIQFTVGSGICLFRAEMAPSSTVKPGALKSLPYPECGDANDAVRISISTSMQVYVQVGGFEAP